MDVTVRLFGPQAQAVGTREVTVQIDADVARCGDLRTLLAAARPLLTDHLPSCRFAVNHEFVADEALVTGTDEVALIGGVSGG